MSSNSGNPELSALWVLYETSDGRDTRAPAMVIEALKNNDGDVVATASELGISRPTLYKWIQDYEVLKRARARAKYLATERSKGMDR